MLREPVEAGNDKTSIDILGGRLSEIHRLFNLAKFSSMPVCVCTTASAAQSGSVVNVHSVVPLVVSLDKSDQVSNDALRYDDMTAGEAADSQRNVTPMFYKFYSMLPC